MTGLERRARWLTILVWLEIIGGVVGLLSYTWFLARYPQIPTWHNLLALAFFGSDIVAGYLLLEGRTAGFVLSFVVQALQVLALNFGTVIMARGGLHLTGVIGSGGAGFFGGPSFGVYTYPAEVGGFESFAFGYALQLGIWFTPLKQARWAVGVNFVALYFSLKLWNTPAVAGVSAPAPVPTGVSPEPAIGRRAPRWVWPVMLCVLVGYAGWFLIGGQRMTSTRRWPLATGDTVAVLVYENHYQANYNLPAGKLEGSHYYWVRFQSDLRDSQRDLANAVAVAVLVCPHADSAGVRRLLVEAAQPGIFKTIKRSYRFSVHPGGACEADANDYAVP